MTFFPGNYNLYIKMKEIITEEKYPPSVNMWNKEGKYYITFALILLIVALILKKEIKQYQLNLK